MWNRHRAREAAVQILYSWEVGRTDAAQAVAAYWAGHEGDPPPEKLRRFIMELVETTVARVDEIDALIAASAENWRVSRMAVLDRLILRMAVGEMLSEDERQPGIIIDEALKLARTFSTDEAVKFINGVLDGVHRRRGGEPGH
ncbi:MAG TPA: transcription antitermination factor NusB [Vicinamibacterales bacterium]|jgi:N utilization substance protein B